jgi:hypothetical protein
VPDFGYMEKIANERFFTYVKQNKSTVSSTQRYFDLYYDGIAVRYKAIEKDYFYDIIIPRVKFVSHDRSATIDGLLFLSNTENQTLACRAILPVITLDVILWML